jgi:hypothetical protein
MYERFTDRARKVMQLAQKEAERFNHDYIGTEHILLGLVKEGAGVAANVLKNLDIDLRTVRLEVEKIVMPGPEMVIMGRLPQTPRAKEVIKYAIEEARNLNHNYVGTEHLLLGLFREWEGVAAQVLRNLGVKVWRVSDLRAEILKYLGQVGPKEDYPRAEPERKQPLSAEREQIRSLEQQLWSVRIVLGVFGGGFIGAQAGDLSGAVWGLILGGFIPLFARYFSAPLAGCLTGILLGSMPIPGQYAGLTGAVLGLLVGILFAVSFTPLKRYGTSIFAAVVTGVGQDVPHHDPYPHAGLCLCGAMLGLMAGIVIEWFVANVIEREPGRSFLSRPSFQYRESYRKR